MISRPRFGWEKYRIKCGDYQFIIYPVRVWVRPYDPRRNHPHAVQDWRWRAKVLWRDKRCFSWGCVLEPH